MGNVIRINCKRVYDTSLFYLTKKDELNDIVKQMEKISANIKAAWNGVDYDNFLLNYSDQINRIKNVISFVDYESEILRLSSNTHSSLDNNFINKIKRSDINEHINKNR